MQIISNRRLQFEDHKIVKDKKTDELKALVVASIIVVPSPNPQIVPDWVKDNDLFKAGIEDGFIIEVVGKPSKPLNTATNNETKDTATPVAEVAPFADPNAWPNADATATGFNTAVSK